MSAFTYTFREGPHHSFLSPPYYNNIETCYRSRYNHRDQDCKGEACPNQYSQPKCIHCAIPYDWGFGKLYNKILCYGPTPHPFMQERVQSVIHDPIYRRQFCAPGNPPVKYQGINYPASARPCSRVTEYRDQYGYSSDSPKPAVKPEPQVNHTDKTSTDTTANVDSSNVDNNLDNRHPDCICRVNLYHSPNEALRRVLNPFNAVDEVERRSAPLEQYQTNVTGKHGNNGSCPFFLDCNEGYQGYTPKAFRRQGELFGSNVMDLRGGEQLLKATEYVHGGTGYNWK